jgi:hypothetical protein
MYDVGSGRHPLYSPVAQDQRLARARSLRATDCSSRLWIEAKCSCGVRVLAKVSLQTSLDCYDGRFVSQYSCLVALPLYFDLHGGHNSETVISDTQTDPRGRMESEYARRMICRYVWVRVHSPAAPHIPIISLPQPEWLSASSAVPPESFEMTLGQPDSRADP